MTKIERTTPFSHDMGIDLPQETYEHFIHDAVSA
jgi:hypothetical protein